MEPTTAPSPAKRKRAPGAGRPKLGEPTKRVTVLIPTRHLGRLARYGNGNISEGLRTFLDELYPND